MGAYLYEGNRWELAMTHREGGTAKKDRLLDACLYSDWMKVKHKDTTLFL